MLSGGDGGKGSLCSYFASHLVIHKYFYFEGNDVFICKASISVRLYELETNLVPQTYCTPVRARKPFSNCTFNSSTSEEDASVSQWDVGNFQQERAESAEGAEAVNLAFPVQSMSNLCMPVHGPRTVIYGRRVYLYLYVRVF